MSMVVSAYQTLLTQFKDWKKISEKEKIELFQHASSLMGRNFREALHLIQNIPCPVQITDFDTFYVIYITYEKFILFKSSTKAKLHDCTCKDSWDRKTGNKAPYMCLHQILLQLANTIFSDKISIEKGDLENSRQLAELLDLIK